VPLQHLAVEAVEAPTVQRITALVGHLVSEGAVADLLYRRFGRIVGDGVIASQAGVEIGFCGWQEDEGLAFVGPIVVRADKQGWGVGSAMLDRTVEILRAAGARTVESAYLSDDPVCPRLFGRFRFREVGTEKRHDRRWCRVERTLKKS